MDADEEGNAGDDGPAETGSVAATYDRIADHFAATREYAWPEVESFVAEWTGDRRVERALDVGCGNGRHAELLADRAARTVALDASRGLLDRARARASDRGYDLDLIAGDAASLPFADGTFDLGVYVATLHHLRPRRRRIASLDELARVLRPDGRALVSAWSTAHDRFDRSEGFDTTVDWTLPGGERVPRYYHIYGPEEFRDDLGSSALRTVDAFVSSGNCYAVVAPA